MTTSVVSQTSLVDSGAAGRALGEEIRAGLNGASPDAVILFASTSHDYPRLLEGLFAACEPKVLVGGSSAGEFTGGMVGQGAACVVALLAPEMGFQATIGRGLRHDSAAATNELVSGFRGVHSHEYGFRSALVLTDATAGHVEEMVQQLTMQTAGTYQFFGGGVGGDDQFQGSRVFFGKEVVPDAVVALEILSNKPLGLGVSHGWKPSSDPLRVTESEGARLVSMNAIAAADVYGDHAVGRGGEFDVKDPLPYFLHNIIGVATPEGHKLRVPLGVDSDGSITCATEVSAGSLVQIMQTSEASASAAAESAVASALDGLGGHRPNVALFFDCVATRLRLGDRFEEEVLAVKRALGDTAFAGCNSIGQIARAEGQFSGFHNCTAVVCVIPD